MKRTIAVSIAVCTPLFLLAGSAAAASEPTAEELRFTIDNLWVLIASFLVFIMHPGFATLEAGLTRAKNTVNILFKNVSIVAIGLLTYAAVGFSLMYPGESFAGGVFGFAGFGLTPPEGAAGYIAVDKRPGVTDDEGRTLAAWLQDLLGTPPGGGEWIARSRDIYWVEEPLSESALECVGAELLGNPLIHAFSCGDPAVKYSTRDAASPATDCQKYLLRALNPLGSFSTSFL